MLNNQPKSYRAENSNLEYYRSFESTQDANDFIALLKQHEIKFLLESSKVILDETIVGTALLPKAILKLHPTDFERVNNLIKHQFENATIEIQGDYLNQLDNNELTDILKNPDEWSIEDGIVAKRILQKRGIIYTEQQIEEFKKEKLENLRKGKKASNVALILYSLGILIGLFLHFILVMAGIGMGYYYAFGKSTDIEGKKYFIYDEQTRFYGKIMFYGGIAVIIIQLTLLPILLS